MSYTQVILALIQILGGTLTGAFISYKLSLSSWTKQKEKEWKNAQKLKRKENIETLYLLLIEWDKLLMEVLYQMHITALDRRHKEKLIEKMNQAKDDLHVKIEMLCRLQFNELETEMSLIDDHFNLAINNYQCLDSDNQRDEVIAEDIKKSGIAIQEAIKEMRKKLHVMYHAS
ncbi:TPA: hypothetical protein ACW7MP_003707 [Enterobacter hormaechei]